MGTYFDGKFLGLRLDSRPRKFMSFDGIILFCLKHNMTLLLNV